MNKRLIAALITTAVAAVLNAGVSAAAENSGVAERAVPTSPIFADHAESVKLTKSRATSLTGLAATGAQASTVSTLGFGPKKCTDVGNGLLCAAGISGSPDGYGASYEKRAGSAVTVRFFLNCINGTQWYYDNGYFTITAGQTKSFVFSIGDKGSCKVGLANIAGGSNLYSPYVVIP